MLELLVLLVKQEMSHLRAEPCSSWRTAMLAKLESSFCPAASRFQGLLSIRDLQCSNMHCMPAISTKKPNSLLLSSTGTPDMTIVKENTDDQQTNPFQDMDNGMEHAHDM